MEELILVGVYITEDQKKFISQSGNASFFVRKLIDEKKNSVEVLN